jgi:Ca2+-binding RTX toxin-like protein
MAEQHLYTYPMITNTKTGKEFISDVQWLWTDGHSSVYSRALSLINGGKGIGFYATGKWSETNIWTWPGPDGWDITWLSDDESSSVHSIQTVGMYSKADWSEEGTHEINGSNGDTYYSSFYYTSAHNLFNDETYTDLYVGGAYSGGHNIEFNGLSGTPDDETDDEIATEAVEWTSSVSYNDYGIRDEQINSLSSLAYENLKYNFSYDVANDYSQGDKNQVDPEHEKFDQSGMYLIKEGTQTFNSYYFLDKSSGFEFEFYKLTSEFDFVNNTATMTFEDIVLVDKGVIYETDLLYLEMTGKEIDEINLGEEIGDSLGGINAHIKKIVLPIINKFSKEAIKVDNLISVANNVKTPVINAGAGADTVVGGQWNDKVLGGDGADNLTGGAGIDSLDGGTGDDVLSGGDGNDKVSGGDGADVIMAGDDAGNDTYDGGKGIDTADYSSAVAGIRIDLAKGTAGSIAANDAAGIGIDKLKGIEIIISGDYADIIIGNKDANSITGGAGNDTIYGGLGKDTLAGGLGADVFVFDTKPAANNVDTISDFQSGEDKIQLSLKTFAKLSGVSDYLVTGTPTTTTQYLIYNGVSGKLSYDADGSGNKVNPVEIAVIGTGLTLSAADFILI